MDNSILLYCPEKKIINLKTESNFNSVGFARSTAVLRQKERIRSYSVKGPTRRAEVFSHTWKCGSSTQFFPLQKVLNEMQRRHPSYCRSLRSSSAPKEKGIGPNFSLLKGHQLQSWTCNQIIQKGKSMRRVGRYELSWYLGTFCFCFFLQRTSIESNTNIFF